MNLGIKFAQILKGRKTLVKLGNYFKNNFRKIPKQTEKLKAMSEKIHKYCFIFEQGLIEQRMLYTQYLKYGPQWIMIRQFFPNRSQNGIKNKFKCSLRKFLHKINVYRKKITYKSVVKLLNVFENTEHLQGIHSRLLKYKNFRQLVLSFMLLPYKIPDSSEICYIHKMMKAFNIEFKCLNPNIGRNRHFQEIHKNKTHGSTIDMSSNGNASLKQLSESIFQQRQSNFSTISFKVDLRTLDEDCKISKEFIYDDCQLKDYCLYDFNRDRSIFSSLLDEDDSSNILETVLWH